MRKAARVTAVAFFLTLAGCLPTKSIIPSTEGGSFVIHEDLTRFQKSFVGIPFMVGLAKGEYIAVGHDSKGTYYRGPFMGVIRLPEESAKRYLETGKRTSLADDPTQKNYDSADEGGVFVPYDPNEKMWFFYYSDSRSVTGDEESNIPPRPHSLINDAPKEATPVEGPRNDMYSFPVVDPFAKPGDLPSPAVAAGTTIGLYVGQEMGRAALREAQGKIMRGLDIQDERIISTIRSQLGR